MKQKEQSQKQSKKQMKKKPIQKQTKLTFFTKFSKSINQQRKQQWIPPSDVKQVVMEEQESQNMMIIDESIREHISSHQSSDPFANQKQNSSQEKIKTQHQGVNKTKQLLVRKSKRKNCLRRQGLDQKNVVNDQKKQRGHKKMKLKREVNSDALSEKSVQQNYMAQFQEKNFNDMLDLEKGFGKKVEYEFNRDGLKMYKIRLTNNSEVVLSQEHARLYFPRLVIDYYKDILGNLANCSGQ